MSEQLLSIVQLKAKAASHLIDVYILNRLKFPSLRVLPIFDTNRTLPLFVSSRHWLVNQHTFHMEPFNLAILVVTGDHVFVIGSRLVADTIFLFFFYHSASI